jgi:hypothetical protein
MHPKRPEGLAVKTAVTEWLRKESGPRNFYELLGHPLLDPDRERMLQTLRAANRELLDYQSHPDPAVSNRAMTLLTELGRARGILEDPVRLQVHSDELLARIRLEFAADRDGAAPGGEALTTWLARQYGLDPFFAGHLAKAVAAASASQPATGPKRGSAKFSAFVSPLPADAPASPVKGEPEVYSLDELDAPVAPSKTKAKSNLVERGEQRPRKNRVASRGSEEEKPSRLPIVLGGSVVALALAIAIVFVLTHETHSKRETVEESVPASSRVDQNAGEPKAPGGEVAPSEVPPVSDPPTLANPKPPVTSNPAPSPEPEKLSSTSQDPASPGSRPSTGSSTAGRKPRNPFRGEDTEPAPEPAQPPVNPPSPAPVAAVKKTPELGRGKWVKAEAGAPRFQVKDVEARIHSAGVKQLVLDSGKKTDDTLVIWVELRNTGGEVRRYKKWMNFLRQVDDSYTECTLLGLDGKAIGKPKWFSPSTKIVEMPSWSDDLDPDRSFLPGNTVTVPLLFAVPSRDVKDLVLTLRAIRVTELNVGLAKEGDDIAGVFRLAISEKEWRK